MPPQPAGEQRERANIASGSKFQFNLTCPV